MYRIALLTEKKFESATQLKHNKFYRLYSAMQLLQCFKIKNQSATQLTQLRRLRKLRFALLIALCPPLQQTLMELDGFWFSIMQFQQFSNYLLLIGGPRVKQIIITPTKKSSKFCKVSKTIVSSRHIKKTDQLCIKQLHSEKSPKFLEASS